MSTPDAERMPERVAGKEIYWLAKVPMATQVMAGRRAASHAAFFTPHLRAGMRLLDCGCGPGTITCDLAGIVAPAEVVGIDFDPKQVDAAVAHAAQQGVTNVRYQTANVYALPFSDGSFDAVFSHTLVEHLSEPLKAIKEMRRVLRTGGLLGMRGPDHDGHIVSPPSSAIAEVLRLHGQMFALNGEDAYVGKHLRGLFHQAGCVHVVASASYECYGTPEGLRRVADGWARVLAPDGPFVGAGLVSPERAAEMAIALQAWAKDPAAFLALARCEAVGWVE